MLIGLGAGVGFVAAGELARKLVGDEDASNGKPKQEPKESRGIIYEPVERNEYFDDNHDFLATITHSRGEYSPKQRKQRRKVLKNGEHIFQDVGLKFYLVQPGDTVSEIRERLMKYDEFSYLRVQDTKLSSFNIPAKKLRAGMWIPIPVEAKDRQLSEAQFVSYAHDGIEQMLKHPAYSKEMKRILDRVSKRELVATMIAVAKQEGGGKPLGQFELHRWEAHQLSFSFSYFHVLMKGPGLHARQNLNLTEGQLYHPLNAVKLFLAFMIEKSGDTNHADRLFPIFEHQEAFARFYNGKQWKRTNPNYLVNVRVYYDEAMNHLDKEGKRWKKDAK